LAKIQRKDERRIKRRLREIDGMIKLIKEQILEKGDMKDGVT
jgi:hypothetical protein